MASIKGRFITLTKFKEKDYNSVVIDVKDIKLIEELPNDHSRVVYVLANNVYSVDVLENYDGIRELLTLNV